MPDVRNAITITTSVVASARPINQWGTPVVFGKSTYATKNTPKAYSLQTDVIADHGETSEISLATASIFKQGVTAVYVVAVTMVGSTATAGEMTTACATCNALIGAGSIHGAVFAAITSDTILESLQTWIDAQKIIGVAMGDYTTSVSSQVSVALGLSSKNLVFVAYKGSEGVDDIAAATLGAIMVMKPWVTPAWKAVSCDVDEYFTPAEVASLETGRICAMINFNAQNRLSTSYSTLSTTMHINSTRIQYYLEEQIKNNVALGVMSAEKVPFTEKGLEVVRGFIVAPLEAAVREGALASYTVVMPQMAAISAEDKTARLLKNVSIGAVSAGDIQTFSLGMTLVV